MEESHEAGDIIFLKGERGVVKTRVRRPDGGDLITNLLEGGEVFGEPGASHRESAHAFTDCRTAKIPEPFLKRMLRERPESAFTALNLLEQRLSRKQELARRLLPRKTESRLAALIPALARKFPARNTDGFPMTNLRLTHMDLAEMVGSTRESVSQSIGRMRREGLVSTENGGLIAILSKEGLREMSEG